MYRSILVPLDGSSFAEHALPMALTLARRSRARLMLVTVSTPLAEAYVEGIYVSTTELEQEMNARQLTYLESTAKKLREKDDVPITVAVKHGDVAVVLCDLLTHGEADVVVMATHGRGAFGRFWLGSVADELIRHTSVPVLLLRPDAGAADLHHEPELSKIVVALDGTELGEQILEPVTALVKLIPSTEIVLVRAVRAIVPIDTAPETPDAEREARTLLYQVQNLQSRLRQDAEQYLETVAARLRERGLRVQTQVVIDDQPAHAILQEAEAQHASMIAMETHGRRGLSRLMLGSVADKVIRGTHIPILVHRPETA
jgi:nucleotide-binding universal stress UspA family protein